MTSAAPAAADQNRRLRPGGSPWPWLVSLFLTMWGAKLWFIGRFGSPLPFWDQWSDATGVFQPYFDGQLSLAGLLSPHSETRPFFTRVYSLALLLLNGQWDAQLHMVINAAMHALTLTGFGWIVARNVGARSRPLLWLPLVAVAVLPFAWESTLAGFHSVFYFMLLFSFPAMVLLIRHPAWSARWWLGLALAFCALFNVASGFIAASAVFAVSVLKICRCRESWKQHLPTLVACGALTITGLLLPMDVDTHHALRAHSISDFVAALGKNLAWPWIVLPPLALANFAPLALLAWFYLRSRGESLPAEELTLTVGLWTIICAMATAYARGANGAHPQWRYMDTTSFALTTNAIALLILWQRYRARLWLGRHAGLACLAWVLMNVAGLCLLTHRAWDLDIPERAFLHRAQLRGVRAYMATGDVSYLVAKAKEQRALFYTEMWIPILEDPNIRSRLPACVREPLKVMPVLQTNGAFVARGWKLPKPDARTEVSWGSYDDHGAEATGTFESQPIEPGRLPFLEIEVAGDLGKPGLSLELVELSNGKRTVVRPRTTPGEAWERCQIKTPAGAFKLVARDESPTGWFAFKAPAGLGWMSWLADEAIAWAPLMFGAGLLLYGLTLFAQFKGRPPVTDPAGRPAGAANPAGRPESHSAGRR